MTVKRFYDLEIWQIARELSKVVWEESNQGTLRNDFGLRDQANRSSGSIMDNIAEGFGRAGNKEFINFLSYSRGSCNELHSQVIRMLDREHITYKIYQALINDSNKLSVKISNMMTYLKNSDLRGQKFK